MRSVRFCLGGLVDLRLSGSFNGASTLASAAGYALVSVDYVYAVLLGDSACGALLYTRTTTDASININYICHDKIPPIFYCFMIISHFYLKGNRF